MHIAAAWPKHPAQAWRTYADSDGLMAAAVSTAAYTALIKEVELTPKPGLVDRFNNGSHRDMNLATFHASAKAIAPWFSVFFRLGLAEFAIPPAIFLSHLRADGLACERAMFRATQGVNTHKGSIFSLGLLCAAAGRLVGAGQAPDADLMCKEVATMCAGLVGDELVAKHEARTAGELLFQKYQMTGARGEAASGFATARCHALLPYLSALAKGRDEEAALHEALLNLLAYNSDTNVVSRGGIEGLAFVQNYARGLLARGEVSPNSRVSQFAEFDQALIARNLSPGGSADLLAVTWFLARFSSLGDGGRASHHTSLTRKYTE